MTLLRSVLIVEDTEADRYIAARVLRKVWPEIEILEARDGREAIELLDGLSRLDGPMPDLILLDVNMPRMNGHEFLESRYGDAGLEVPVVMMLTSSGQTEDRERAQRFGCVRNYIVKPIDKATIERLPELLAA